MTAKAIFNEHIYVEESAEFISSAVDVYTDGDGYFIRIETDPHEGLAIVTLPVARKLIEALKRAVESAEKERLEARHLRYQRQA